MGGRKGSGCRIPSGLAGSWVVRTAGLPLRPTPVAERMGGHRPRAQPGVKGWWRTQHTDSREFAAAWLQCVKLRMPLLDC